MNTSKQLHTKLQKLKDRKSKLEDHLLEAKLDGHRRINNLGWGYGMRCVKMPTFTKEDNIKEKLKIIQEKIKQLENQL